MSISCEKDLQILVSSLDWTQTFPLAYPTETTLTETSLSSRFAITVLTDSTAHAPEVVAKDEVYYESEVIGPYAENMNITVTGTTTLNWNGSFPSLSPSSMFLELKDTPVTTLVDATIIKGSGQVPFTGPINFTYELPAGNTAFFVAGLAVTGNITTCSVDITISVTPVPPP